jgi:tRNA (guanine37-N1)-methyltransferase
MRVIILTCYPEMFPGSLGYSVIGNALVNNKFSLEIINLHDFGIDKRGSVDDEPFGGGPGMVIRPDVIEKALNSITFKTQKFCKIFLTPSGQKLSQTKLSILSKYEEMLVLCGRFEGVDQRAIEILGFQEISIGDYVLSGGEIAAQVLVEGCIRLIPGVLGHPQSLLEESFSNNLLEYPHYTRPRVWEDNQGNKHEVPDVLISGHHEKIDKWRNERSLEKTKFLRPDLLKKENKNE